MDVKEAVGLAKKYISELFADEGLLNLGLEEVDYDDARDEWHITLGFSRPWDNQVGALAAAFGQSASNRTYKVVLIDKVGRAVSVKNRDVQNAG